VWIEVVEREEAGSGDMGGGEFGRGANVEQLGGGASLEEAMEIGGRDGRNGLQSTHISMYEHITKKKYAQK
jgi:hypothetical protein